MNLFNYISIHENETFNDFKFTEVDNLILSLLAYLDFTNIVPAFKKGKISLKDAFSKYSKPKNDFFLFNTFKMFKLMANTKRYKDIILYNYVKIINDEMQFGALTMKLNDSNTFVAFAGTDTSIIGWEEDFKMACFYPGASQKYAGIYLDKTIKLKDQNVIIGGHSKGGNLAISAALRCKFYIRRKIIAIYNNDGPGFLKEQIESFPYQRIKKKIKMYVPKDSIIGMILYPIEDYTVVKSKSFNIFQHNAFNWLVNNNSFIKEKQNKRSIKLQVRLNRKLEEIPPAKKLIIINQIFDIFHDNKIKDAKEIRLKNIFNLIKSFKVLDKETQNMLLELIIILFFK